MTPIEKMREICRGATKGPWKFVDTPSNQFVVQTTSNRCICALAGITSHTEDFTHIAAHDPELMEAVWAEIEAGREWFEAEQSLEIAVATCAEADKRSAAEFCVSKRNASVAARARVDELLKARGM